MGLHLRRVSVGVGIRAEDQTPMAQGRSSESSRGRSAESFRLPWREAGPLNHLGDKVDPGQQVVNTELSLKPAPPPSARGRSIVDWLIAPCDEKGGVSVPYSLSHNSQKLETGCPAFENRDSTVVGSTGNERGGVCLTGRDPSPEEGPPTATNVASTLPWRGHATTRCTQAGLNARQGTTEFLVFRAT